MRKWLMVSLLALGMIGNVAAMANNCEEHPASLAAMQDCYRPLLLFAPSASDETLRAELLELEAHASELRERDVLIVMVLEEAGPDFSRTNLPLARLTGDEAAAARKRFGIRQNEFAILLIGKDGGEKLRQNSLMSAAKLNHEIDGMPMRKEEMRRR